MGVQGGFIDQDLFRSAMRELPGSVTIVAAGEGAERRGLTATAICSLSVDPPSLIACINRQTDGCAAIRRYGCFSVNVIAAEHETLANRFAGRGDARGADRFNCGRWIRLSTGAPVLEDAVVAFDCVVLEAIEYSSHTVFIGGVQAAKVAAERQPLVYHSGSYHVIGQGNQSGGNPLTNTAGAK